MKVIRLFFVLACLSVTAACAVNPVTGKQEVSLIPESQELAIGAEQYLPAQQSQGGLYTVDPGVNEYVSEVGQRLAAVSDRDLPYEFVVLNDSTPNAWALPGGKIAVNRGLLTSLGSEAELAAVLGHEIVHAAAKHGAKAMQRGLMLQGVVLASQIGAAMSESDYANYVVGGAQLGAQLINQRYGRDAELEADYYGMQYMARAGYDPDEAVTLQETFVELSGGQTRGWLDGLFASHPPSEARVEANRETAAALDASGDIGVDRYMRATARLFESKPAYDAFDQAQGMLAQGLTDDAMSFVNRALSIEPDEPRFYGLKGEILLVRKDYDAAIEAFDNALVRDDGFYEYYLGRGLAFANLGDRRRARTELERSNQLLPTAIANSTLGNMSLAAGERTQAKEYFSLAMNGQGKVATEAERQFVKLDLADNPMQYMRARAFLSDSLELRAEIGNGTNYPVHSVQVEFSIMKNGERVSKSGLLNGLIPANFLGEITSGMTFQPEDELADPQLQILSVVVAD